MVLSLLVMSQILFLSLILTVFNLNFIQLINTILIYDIVGVFLYNLGSKLGEIVNITKIIIDYDDNIFIGKISFIAEFVFYSPKKIFSPQFPKFYFRL